MAKFVPDHSNADPDSSALGIQEWANKKNKNPIKALAEKGTAAFDRLKKTLPEPREK